MRPPPERPLDELLPEERSDERAEEPPPDDDEPPEGRAVERLPPPLSEERLRVEERGSDEREDDGSVTRGRILAPPIRSMMRDGTERVDRPVVVVRSVAGAGEVSSVRTRLRQV